MIALLAPFLKSCQGSCHDYGDPQGAIALGVAVVCAFYAFMNQILQLVAVLKAWLDFRSIQLHLIRMPVTT